MQPHPLALKFVESLRGEAYTWEPRPPSPSNIMRCVRQHWFRARKYPMTNPPEAGAILMMDEGWLVEPKVVDLFTSVGWNAERKVECDWSWWPGSPGTPDGVATDEQGTSYIVDAKRLGAWSFSFALADSIREHTPDYYTQVQLYMKAAGVERALIVALCADYSATNTISKMGSLKGRIASVLPVIVEEYEYDHTAVEEACRRAEYIQWQIENINDPADVEREYDPFKARFPCGYCAWQDACKDVSKSVSGGDAQSGGEV